MNKKMNIRFGLATVAPNGLLFNGLYYSNIEMIKFNSFTLAEIHGNWQIPILYDELESRHVILLDFDQLEIASSINTQKEIDPDIIDSYQKAIQNLKDLLSMKRNY